MTVLWRKSTSLAVFNQNGAKWRLCCVWCAAVLCSVTCAPGNVCNVGTILLLLLHCLQWLNNNAKHTHSDIRWARYIWTNEEQCNHFWSAGGFAASPLQRDCHACSIFRCCPAVAWSAHLPQQRQRDVIRTLWPHCCYGNITYKRHLRCY